MKKSQVTIIWSPDFILFFDFELVTQTTSSRAQTFKKGTLFRLPPIAKRFARNEVVT